MPMPNTSQTGGCFKQKHEGIAVEPCFRKQQVAEL